MIANVKEINNNNNKKAPSNTSCVEQGYSSLEMICAPRRNRLTPEHLETLFLLATLKIPVKRANEYGTEAKLLENVLRD